MWPIFTTDMLTKSLTLSSTYLLRLTDVLEEFWPRISLSRVAKVLQLASVSD